MCKVDKTDVHTYTLVIYAYQEKWQLWFTKKSTH